MNRERITRREFLKMGLITGTGLVVKAFLDDRSSSSSNAQEGHKVFLPFVSKEKPLDDLVRLVDEHELYGMRVNPYFSRNEWESLFQKYNKSKIVFYWVDRVEKVPYDPYEGRAWEVEGETGMVITCMMAFYSGTLPQEVEFWLYDNEEYFQRYSDRKINVLSGHLSYKVWQAIAAPNRNFLFGAPAPQPTNEEIEKYFRTNTLILVSSQ